MRRTTSQIMIGCLAAALAGLAPIMAAGQGTPRPSPMPTKIPVPGSTTVMTPPLPGKITGTTPPGKLMKMGGGENYERSIAVNQGAKLNMCVVEGVLRVNGWNRNEIRIFVKNGSRFDFEVKQTTNDGSPVWLQAIANDPKKTNRAFPNCVWGETIEVDAPTGAAFEISGQEYRANIDSVRKAYVKAASGSITLRNISAGVTANTYGGNIIVEESGGMIDLESTLGNIIVLDVHPSEIGDGFKAKTTNGNISLEALDHGQVSASSISGSVIYTGKIRKGGDYRFITQNGSIRLTLPEDTSAQLGVVYGAGILSSELPAKLLTEEISTGQIKSKNFMLGKGGATVKAQSTNGSIIIKKQIIPAIAD